MTRQECRNCGFSGEPGEVMYPICRCGTRLTIVDIDRREQIQLAIEAMKERGGRLLIDGSWQPASEAFSGRMVMPEVDGQHMFVFRPIGHGPKTLYITADSPEEALIIATNHVVAAGENCAYDYFGFGTNEYKVTAVRNGQVAENDNE